MNFQFTQSLNFQRIIYFFPFQLVVIHFKKNLALLLFWFLLIGFITKNLGNDYGMAYLFLDPEYLGRVDFWSYLMLGFSLGGFIIAFNISSYIINAARFPFIATLNRPFFKYCLNNFIIPAFFVIIYLYHIIAFQINNEYLPSYDVFMNVSGFLSGMFLFIIIAISYFFTTDKDIFKVFGISIKDIHLGKMPRKRIIPPLNIILNRQLDWKPLLQHHDDDKKKLKTLTYMPSLFSVALARGTSHYEQSMIDKVFQQNHLNAAVFEILVLIALLTLGLFREYPIFIIPAGASIFLFATMLLMLSSAIHSWFRGWSSMLFILIFLLLNYLSDYDFISRHSRAYGLNYDAEIVNYNIENITKLNSPKYLKDDLLHHIDILNLWKLKCVKAHGGRKKKPKLVIVNTSGGGLRSSLWTFTCMQTADSILGGKLMKQTHLITGASGGMIGAAYIRELFREKNEGRLHSFYNDTLKDNIGKDLLNPIAFSIAVNDLFFRLQKFTDSEYKYKYTKDRGYAFEEQLKENTNHLLDKRMGDFYLPEMESKIPIMIFAPTIINDGRALYICSQPISFLNQVDPQTKYMVKPLPEGIEMKRFFSKHNPDNLRLTSAIRMNATFPYIVPVVSMPSKPVMEIMDAGIRDNYGLITSIKYLFALRNWINENTSGVVIMQMRDGMKNYIPEESPSQLLLNMVLSPVGNIYNNLFSMQDFDHDIMRQYAGTWLNGKLDIIDFQLRHDSKDKIAMSWHLTTREKDKIKAAIFLPENREAMTRLKKLLE